MSPRPRQMPVDLPPAGDERREELKRREDALAEQAETQGADGGAIDPSKFEIENELAQHFDELEVSGRDPMYTYKWQQAGFYGRFMKADMARGWEVVQGDMPEAIELKGMGADTTRRLGDVILMRCRKDIFKMLQRKEDAHRKAIESGTTTELEELGRKHEGRGVKIHTEGTMSPEMQKQLATRAAARQAGMGQVDRLIREGRMPGVPSPGR